MTSLLPWRDRQVDRFRSEVDRLFEDFFTRDPFRGFLGEGDWMPAVDVSETGKKIVVKAEVPGMDAKDIDISLNGRVLTIKGEKRDEHKEEGENYHRVERFYGSFMRSFDLPTTVDQNGIKASYDKGVLKVVLPKKEEVKPKKVAIEVK